jgi:hypothetical protein
MKQRLSLLLCALVLPAGLWRVASAEAESQEKYSVQILKEAPPKELSEDVRKTLAESGYRVLGPADKVVCDVWIRKQLVVGEKFEPTVDVKYGFARSHLIGAVRFPKESEDIREQELGGVYTMRYAQQPVDGNHIGTWPYMDFVALLTAKQDPKPEDRDEQDVVDLSMAGRAHPAILSLNPPGKRDKLPAVVHQDLDDLWVLALPAKAKKGDETTDLELELVVVGTAEI